jgi:L-lactate dehydrogenase complex protein LldF
LHNRREAVRTGEGNMMEKIAWSVWQQGMLHRKMMNLGSSKIKNWMINKVFKGWTGKRAELDFPQKTFNQRWTEMQEASKN